MPMTLSGNGQIGGLTPGGLPDGSVKQEDLAANVVGHGPAFSAYATAITAIPSGAWTKVNFQNEEFDTTAAFDTAVSRYIPQVAGYYQINAAVSFAAATGPCTIGLYKNGIQIKGGSSDTLDSVANTVVVSSLLYMNGTTDYLEISVFQNSGGSVNIVATANTTYINGFLARAA